MIYQLYLLMFFISQNPFRYITSRFSRTSSLKRRMNFKTFFSRYLCQFEELFKVHMQPTIFKISIIINVNYSIFIIRPICFILVC
ncbi:Uncharacterised protein [Streptococcus pneumoniae]|nr:Uncharacterised protein [Streptococcus pneumoniae]CKU78592.1 Uncharacterised protein [Mycobacterium tuberculosis]